MWEVDSALKCGVSKHRKEIRYQKARESDNVYYVTRETDFVGFILGRVIIESVGLRRGCLGWFACADLSQNKSFLPIEQVGPKTQLMLHGEVVSTQRSCFFSNSH